MTNLTQQIQTLSEMRNELYAQAGEVSLSNPEQAKALWAAADALVKAMDAIESAQGMEKTVQACSGNAWDGLLA